MPTFMRAFARGHAYCYSGHEVSFMSHHGHTKLVVMASRPGVAWLAVVVLSAALLGGCAHKHPHAAPRTAMAVGALAVVAGLMLAGGCDSPAPKDPTRGVPGGCGSSKGGRPNVGVPLAVAGLATMVAGQEALRHVHPHKPRTPNTKAAPVQAPFNPVPPAVQPDPFVPPLEPIHGSVLSVVR